MDNPVDTLSTRRRTNIMK